MRQQQSVTAGRPHQDDFWVFGYGSLMWDPGFEYLERHSALLHGWHRAFSLLSTVSWGSAEEPGMVLTLHRGGACRGVAMRVAAENRAAVDAYLQQREQAYRHVDVGIRTVHGRMTARTFVSDPSHPRFIGKLPKSRTAELICQGSGGKGTSVDYLTGTVRSLENIGCQPGRYLRDLLAEVEMRRRG
jgi:cation transport protein ChaC